MKTIFCLMLGFGNITMTAALSGPTLEHWLVTSLATSLGAAGFFSWRWLLSQTSTSKLADVRISE